MDISKELEVHGIKAHFIQQGKMARVDGKLFTERNVVFELHKGTKPSAVAEALAKYVNTMLRGAKEITVRDLDVVFDSTRSRAITAVGIKE